MTLEEIIAQIDAFADDLEIRARHPWTAESEAFVVEPDDESAGERVCRVTDAKEKLRPYVGDPAPMRLARLVAYAESLRADRDSAARAAHTFSVTGRAPASYFEDVRRPERPGQYRYMPYRSHDHHELATALLEGRPIEWYALADSACRFRRRLRGARRSSEARPRSRRHRSLRDRTPGRHDPRR